MELARRIRWIASSLPVVVAAAAVIGRPWPPGVLAAGPAGTPACTTAAHGAPASDAAWYRLDPVLDASGTLAGRQLSAGRGSGRWTVTLPPESFASGPVGGRLVVGDDDGRRSRLRVLDTVSGCWTTLGEEPDVVRSAVLSTDGASLYEHRVERSSRRDLGVWRRSPVPSSAALQVLPGLGADPAYGPTFATSLVAVVDGRLIASACGERACRTRVVGTGPVASVGGTGPAVGLAGDGIVALEVCDGLPCELTEISLSTGARSPLGEASGQAAMAPDGTGLVVAPGGAGLGVLRATAGAKARGVAASAGLAPLVVSSTADSGMEAPAGSIAVAPGGRVDDPSAVRFLDPSTLTLSSVEVLP